jgi:hypothetical protein
VVKYHGLVRRYRLRPRFLMRPLLNGGTLGGRDRTEPVASLFEVAFTEPRAGWIGLRVTAEGVLFDDSFSHIYPSLEQLCGALCDAIAGVQARRVTFLLEPAELELVISPTDVGTAHLAADLYSDSRRVLGARSSRLFEFRAPPPAIALPFWRALRRLQTYLPVSDFEREWREPFPASAMASLTSVLKTATHDS